MESLGLVRREVPGVEGGPQTPVEIASEIPAYSRQAYTGAKWIFIILSSTLLNAFLFGVGVKLHFIFGMAIPLIAQRAGSDLFAKSLFVPAMVWRATAAAVYVLFSFLY